MASTLEHSLEKAEEAFYSQRLVESYNILRRFYDRLPFVVDKSHAKYVGMFIRILFELGKEKQLQFYLAEIEKKYSALKSDGLAYQLGAIHLVRKEYKQALSFLNEVVRSSKDSEIVIKAKMCLMSLYCQETPPNFVACRSLIETIAPPSDPKLADLLIIWDANILRYEGRLDMAQCKLEGLLSRLSRHQDWYTYFSAQIILGYVFLNQKQQDKVRALITQIQSQFGILSFKCVRARIDDLQAALQDQKEFAAIRLESESLRGEVKLSYQGKSLTVNSHSITDKLLLQIVKEGFVPRSKLAGIVCSDDRHPKLVRQAIHSKLSMVRKRLRILGLPSHVIVVEEDGYRFVPKVVKESNT